MSSTAMRIGARSRAYLDRLDHLEFRRCVKRERHRFAQQRSQVVCDVAAAHVRAGNGVREAEALHRKKKKKSPVSLSACHRRRRTHARTRERDSPRRSARRT
jgi:hypothetical protein